MTLMIDLTPELETRLQEQAAQHGMSVSEYARTLLQREIVPQSETAPPRAYEPPADASQATGPGGGLPFYTTASAEEWEQAFDQWIKRHGIKGHHLPLEALRREHMYGERG